MPEVEAGEGPVRAFHQYLGFLQLVLSPHYLWHTSNDTNRKKNQLKKGSHLQNKHTHQVLTASMAAAVQRGPFCCHLARTARMGSLQQVPAQMGTTTRIVVIG